MRYLIRHTTHHRYSQPVFLEPHTFRLRPRTDGTQRLLRYDLQIGPSPAGRSETLDAEGNASTQAWFLDLTNTLTVTTSLEVETLRANPFDFFLDPVATTVPVTYSEELRESLNPYLTFAPPDERVTALTQNVAQAAQNQTVPFLISLTEQIQRQCRQIIREEGDPWTPVETLERGEGSCRDLSVLAMAACRAMGLASRFVSGYQEGDPNQARRYLHAWIEVYLPGGGWRGFDPTLGLAVADRHIPLAASRRSFGASPIDGAFRGTGVQSEMNVEIELETVKEAVP